MINWILGILLAGMFVLAVVIQVKRAKKGNGCSGCSGCSMSGKCDDYLHESIGE